MRQGKIDFTKTTANQLDNFISTSSSFQVKPKDSKSSKHPPLPQEKILSIQCHCDVQENGFINQEIKRKENNKVLVVYIVRKLTQDQQVEQETLFFKILYQKSCEIAFEFRLKDISAVFAQKVREGMISIQLIKKTEEDNNKNKTQTTQQAKNLGRMIATQYLATENKYVVFLNKMSPQLADSLSSLLQKYLTAKIENPMNNREESKLQQRLPAPSSMSQTMESKKRKLDQITNVKETQQMVFNPRQKIRKLTVENPTQSQQSMLVTECSQQSLPNKQNISLLILPWDCLNVILDYAPKDIYKTFRVNRELFWLINKRKKGLTFKDTNITSKVFFNLIEKSQAIERFTIRVSKFGFVSIKDIELNMIVFNKLKELDLVNFQHINESSLSRIINGCRKSLTKLKLNYVSNAFGRNLITCIVKCKSLKTLQLGEYDDYYKTIQPDRLELVKRLLKHKTFTLEYLTLYQADQQIITYLSEQPESTSLLQLCIVQFIQTNKVKLEEIESLKKFKNLQSLNLCSTYYPLEFKVEVPNESNDQMISVAGSRELELITFSMKNNLRILSLGDYIYDDLMNYIGEMCRNVEKLEINSEQLSDRGLISVFKGWEKLKYIDLAACPRFQGQALYDAEPFAAKELKRFIVSLRGYDMDKLKEKLQKEAPECVIELKMKKQFKLK